MRSSTTQLFHEYNQAMSRVDLGDPNSDERKQILEEAKAAREKLLARIAETEKVLFEIVDANRDFRSAESIGRLLGTEDEWSNWIHDRVKELLNDYQLT